MGKIEFPEHVVDYLIFLSKKLDEAAVNATGSWSARNPLAGKMRTCLYCGTRRRDSVRSVAPCCFPKMSRMAGKLDRTASPAVIRQTLRSLVGAAQFARKRRHPHPNAKKLQCNELRLRLEVNDGTRIQAYEALGSNAHHRSKGLVTYLESSPLATNPADAGPLSEKLVAARREKKAKRIRKQQRESRRKNRRPR